MNCPACTLGDVAVFLAGAFVVGAVFLSAVSTVVVPRGVPVRLTRVVFRTMRRLFGLRSRFASTYEERDRALALYAPLTLIVLPVVWVAITLFGFSAMYWALGVHPARQAFVESGSSLLTLGFVKANDLPTTVVAFAEAAIGLILLALLITFLPSMYGAFSRREHNVAMVTILAGSPPSPAEMIMRFHAIRGLDEMEEEVWKPWLDWFVDIEESHTSFAGLPFFRSPQPDRSWITAAGVVLDAAALYASTLDVPRSPAAELSIRSGYLTLRRIADFYSIPYDPNPAPTDPISVSREEYEAVYDQLAGAGVPLRADRDAAWRDFAGWRVNYDTVLIILAGFVMAPYAPWISDRSPLRRHRPPILRRRPPTPPAR
jgi:fumarate reductase subunit D